MLQEVNGKIVESRSEQATRHQLATQNYQDNSLQNSSYSVNGCFGGEYQLHYSQPVYWNTYPVYVCSDKTAKAIEILKKLQAEKVIDVKSVPKFIELVEQISGIL